jgi:hypothetical protein
MKFKIHDSESFDSIVVEQDTLEECQYQAQEEADKRNWINPWSEKL